MLNNTFNNVGPLQGCHFKFIDSGAFRCKNAYIRIYSADNESITLAETKGSSGFDYANFISKTFCAGGIEVGYDIAWGMNWPIRQRFIHGQPFREKNIDLNHLTIKISGTTFHPSIYILDGSQNEFKYSP